MNEKEEAILQTKNLGLGVLTTVDMVSCIILDTT
jgi:hypothetical protein